MLSMKLLIKLGAVVLAALNPATGKVLQRGVVNDFYNKDLDALDAIMKPKAAPTTAPDTETMKDILENAKWPAREDFDKTFSTVAFGAVSAPCSAPLLGRARLSPWGLGAHLNQFANEVEVAMYTGKPMALCAPPDVRDSWARYFQDPGFSRCSTCDWGVGPHNYRQMGWDIGENTDQSPATEMKRYLYKKLMTLNVEAQSTVDQGLSELGLSQTTYVGVHIRRGDKSQEVPPVPTQRYAAAVVEMANKVGANTVFLASDDAAVHGELQEQLGSSYKIVEQQRLPPEDYALRGAAARSNPPPFGEEDEEKSFLIDVGALVHSAAFVGTASSNIGRLVYFQREPTAPAVSLDEGGNSGFLSLSMPDQGR